MARAKKEAALTPEERLQAALVPDWEWPYKLPENWCWVQLSTVKQGPDGFFDGDWILSDNMDENGDVRLLQLSDIGITEFLDKSNKHINHATFEKLGCTELEAGDVMISRMAEPVARSCIVPHLNYKVITAVDVAVLRCNKEIANNRYINYLCNVKWFTDRATILARGTTRIRITRQNLGEMPIPLSPLTEQQRIVDRIESLFSKLDEAKKMAQAVVDSFETRKAAILHKAFAGELTANWREEHGVGMDSWEKAPFETIIEKMQNGLAKRNSDSGKPYVVLRLANLSDSGINTDDLREILLDEKEQANYELMPNDVIMVRVNGSKDNVGKQYLVTNQNNWAFCDHLIRIRYSEKVLPQYMTYFAQSEEYRFYVKDNIVSSAGQNTISRKGMANLLVPVPQNNEQLEIVRILNDLFAKEQQVKEAAEAVLDQIDLMKKSILARAFRGELGTNDPNDEPAVELVKKVLDIPAEPRPAVKRKFIPKELEQKIKTDLERKIIKLYIQNETDSLSTKQLMGVSSKKFDIMETLRNLQNRGILTKENDTYKLMG